MVSHLPIADVNESWANKSVLITGSEGFVGSHLCRHLVKVGAKVVGLIDKISDSQICLGSQMVILLIQMRF